MSEIHLNKFEKEKRVIELHKEGKTIRAIAPIVHMSFGPISKIIKTYEKKVQLENKKENNQQKTTQKKSISSRAFILFRKGKDSSEVKVLLDIPFKKAKIFWAQYLNLERMSECYHFYMEFRYEIPNLLSIGTFMKRNSIPGNNIANVLRTADNVVKLNQIEANLKNEIERLKQTKIDYSLRPFQPIQPLGPLPSYYNW
jgi:hypothetical protein